MGVDRGPRAGHEPSVAARHPHPGGAFEAIAWVAALVALVGDLSLTVYGLERGFVEANPLARTTIEWLGYLGIAGLKLLVFAGAVLAYWYLPDRFGYVVPSILTTIWGAAVLVNVVVLSVGP